MDGGHDASDFFCQVDSAVIRHLHAQVCDERETRRKDPKEGIL